MFGRKKKPIEDEEVVDKKAKDFKRYELSEEEEQPDEDDEEYEEVTEEDEDDEEVAEVAPKKKVVMQSPEQKPSIKETKEPPSEPKITINDILLNHEARLKDIESSLYRFKQSL